MVASREARAALRWSKEEIAYLERHASDGAEAVASRLGRSVHAVEVMASRMGVSLRPSWQCPNCGRTTYRPLDQRTGWCKACTIEASHDVAAAKNREIRAMIREEEQRIQAAKRRRQAVYSENTRAKKKLRRLRESREVNEK